MIKIINRLLFTLGILLISCNSSEFKLTEDDIDKIVTSITDSSQVYDITQSLRFSNNDEQYSVVQCNKNDTAKLYIETISNKDSDIIRQIFLDKEKIVYVKESGLIYNGDSTLDYETQFYYFNEDELAGYQKDNSIDGSEFKKIDEKRSYSVDKPENAINQDGDFELKFGEFLIIEPQTYLILENKTSNYNAALFIIKGDYLLDELFTNPEKHKGKTIFANHEFKTIGGINRMIYKGGILIDKD